MGVMKQRQCASCRQWQFLKENVTNAKNFAIGYVIAYFLACYCPTPFKYFIDGNISVVIESFGSKL